LLSAVLAVQAGAAVSTAGRLKQRREDRRASGLVVGGIPLMSWFLLTYC
jgi:hypothetical protein